MQQPVQQQNLSEIVHFDLIPNIRFKDVIIVLINYLNKNYVKYVVLYAQLRDRLLFFIVMSYVRSWLKNSVLQFLSPRRPLKPSRQPKKNIVSQVMHIYVHVYLYVYLYPYTNTYINYSY